MTHTRMAEFFAQSRRRRRLHLASFDPAKHRLDTVAATVEAALAAGVDGFLLGGSTGVDGPMVEACGAAIQAVLRARFRNEAKPPLLLFPSSAATGAAASADGVLFLSLLNSSDVRYLIREQAQAAPYLPAFGLEPVGCGMICVAPGGAAGRVGRAELIARDDWRAAVGYAAAAAAFGFPLVYLNAGSGSPDPVPAAMIAATAQVVRTPLIVGGGLVDAARARAAVEAGADIVVTGTALEIAADVRATLGEIAAAVHAVAPKEGRPEKNTGDRI